MVIARSARCCRSDYRGEGGVRSAEDATTGGMRSAGAWRGVNGSLRGSLREAWGVESAQSA